MDIRKTIDQDWKDAMKSGDTVKKTILSTLRSELANKEKELKAPLDGPATIAVVGKELKKLKATASEYDLLLVNMAQPTGPAAANVVTEINKLSKEIEALEVYMPEQMNLADLEALVDEAIASLPNRTNSIKDMGPVMKIVSPKVAGSVDGKTLSDAVKRKVVEV